MWCTQYDPVSSNRLVVGNMTRGLDVYDADTGRLCHTLRSEALTAVPTRSAIHPALSIIASSTASGRLYLWSSEPADRA